MAADNSPSNSDTSTSSLQMTEEVLQQEVACLCSDGQVNVRVAILLQSKTFETMWKLKKDLYMASGVAPENFEFPVKTLPVNTFTKVKEWMENHVGKPAPVVEEDPITRERKWFTLSDYEKEFFNVDVHQLAEYLVAGNFLDLQSLYLFGCQSMAALIKDKSPEEIRNLLGLEDDLAEAEKTEIRRKNVWCNY